MDLMLDSDYASDYGEMGLESSKRPLNVLMKALNTNVTVKLKSNVEYHGKMVRCDNYMNIILEGGTESYESNLRANYGNVFIRGNNVLYINVKT